MQRHKVESVAPRIQLFLSLRWSIGNEELPRQGNCGV